MTRQQCRRLVCAAFVILALAGSLSVTSAQTQPPANAAAATAAKASPELISALSKEIGATPEQAAGAAGALFNVAKSKLTADQFAQVSKAVPGMSSLLSAAPALGGVAGTTGAMSQATGSASGLASAASAFSKLGLSPDMVGKAVPVLTNFVTTSGGADVGKLLAGALK